MRGTTFDGVFRKILLLEDQIILFEVPKNFNLQPPFHHVKNRNLFLRQVKSLHFPKICQNLRLLYTIKPLSSLPGLKQNEKLSKSSTSKLSNFPFI